MLFSLLMHEGNQCQGIIELERIEAAINYKNIEELNCAEKYCSERLATAKTKEC